MSGTLDSLIWLLVAVLLLLVLAACAIAFRRFMLERGGGTIECALRPLPGGSWRHGVASYRRDELHWFRAIGVRLRPAAKFTRRSVTVVSRREVSASEAGVLGPGRAVVEISAGPPGAGSAGPGVSGPAVELGMTTEALTGFLSWLEASPPSSHLEDIA